MRVGSDLFCFHNLDLELRLHGKDQRPYAGNRVVTSRWKGLEQSSSTSPGGSVRQAPEKRLGKARSNFARSFVFTFPLKQPRPNRAGCSQGLDCSRFNRPIIKGGRMFLVRVMLCFRKRLA